MKVTVLFVLQEFVVTSPTWEADSTVSQEISTFYGIRMFITVFTTATAVPFPQRYESNSQYPPLLP
jgi:hypothetical protein